MVIDTFLLAMVMLVSWNWHPALVGAFTVIYSFISCAYLSSNLEKIPHGAWFSIALSGILSIIAYVYWWGGATKAAYIRNHIIPLSNLFEPGSNSDQPSFGPTRTPATLRLPVPASRGALLSNDNTTLSDQSALTVHLHPGIKPLRLAGTKLPVARLPGLGLYYSECLDGVPPVLVQFLSLSPAIHEVVVMVTIRRVLLPTVPSEQRLLVRKLDVEGFYHVVARYGYMEDIVQGEEFVSLMVDEILEYLNSEGIDEAISQASFGDVERGSGSGGSGPSTMTAAMTATTQGIMGPRFSSNTEGSKVNPSPGVSLSTATGQHLLAEIQARLRGETGLAREPARRPPLFGYSTSESREDSRRGGAMNLGGKTPRSAQILGTVPSGSTYPNIGSTTLPPLPGQALFNEYPWVRQPSVFNRIRGFSSGNQDTLLAAVDATATVPLPPPPSRPLIHRLSAPVPEAEKKEEVLDINEPTPTGVERGPVETAFATISGRNAELLRQRLVEEQAKGKIFIHEE